MTLSSQVDTHRYSRELAAYTFQQFALARSALEKKEQNKHSTAMASKNCDANAKPLVRQWMELLDFFPDVPVVEKQSPHT